MPWSATRRCSQPPATRRAWVYRLSRTCCSARRREPRGPRSPRRSGKLAAPDSVRLRESGQARWLRDDDTLPVVLRKKLFGEFAADPNVAPGKWLAVDPRWEMEHLQTVRLPLIREIRCNRAIIAPLRAALEEIERRGLGDLITTQRGCYAPRRLFERNFVKLSNHAWGSAFDINVESNPFGKKPRQDPRIVEVFARHGFTWGGTWLVPDGMHFEWIGDR